MKRRHFLSSSIVAGALTAPTLGAATSPAEKPKAAKGPAMGEPLIAGPDPSQLAILQALQSPASGYVEISVNGGEWQKVLPEQSGMVAYESHVLNGELLHKVVLKPS